MRRILVILSFLLPCYITLQAQINTDRVLTIGRNALYFEDYVLSIQYFNQIIKIRPYLAEPYFYRAVAKVNLEDYQGALDDATSCLERNPFIVNAYQVRGIALQQMEQYKQSIEAYDKGLVSAPENKIFLLNRAVAYAQLGDNESAKASFDKLVLIHPSYSQAYMSRSGLMMEMGDTLAALRDISKAIQVDKYSSPAYAQRSMIRASLDSLTVALRDINQAIRLEPEMSGYYINRALIKYHQQDLRGAMADYDQVIDLDEDNVMAHYNRGLLRAYVGDKNRAVNDFTQVIRQQTDNSMARYNRAILYADLGNYRAAILDYTAVLDEHPDFTPVLYARSEAKHSLNDLQGAEADYMMAYEMDRKRKEEKLNSKKDVDTAEAEDDQESVRKESDRNIAKFNRLMIADNNDEISRYDNSIRGRVQDRDVAVDLIGAFVLSYYEKGDQVRQSVHHDEQITLFNNEQLLTRRILPVSDMPALTQSQADGHFESINTYSKLIEISPNNPLPYLGRSVDFMLVQDYQNAVDDLNRVLLIKPDFVLAYFNRAALRMRLLESRRYEDGQVEPMTVRKGDLQLNLSPAFQVAYHADQQKAQSKLKAQQDLRKLEYELVMRDYDYVIQLDPKFVYAYFNRGNLHCSQKNFDLAIQDYNDALLIYPEFAEAYFNRGLVYLYQGHTAKGIADLSKAGELGIVAAYNVIKRMSND